MSQQPEPTPPADEAMSVLRGIWGARGQTSADIVEAAPSNAKVCKNMRGIGFQGIATGDEDANSTTPVDEDLRASWRRKLEREGKLGTETVRDLVLGPADEQADKQAGEPPR